MARRGRARIVELSHTIRDEMPSYPGLPRPRVRQHLTHEQSLGRYDDDATFEISRIEMVGNTGTYLDSPAHRYPGRPDVAALPLAALVDLPAIVIAADGDLAQPVTVEVGPHMAGAAVLIRTGWDARWGTERYYDPAPYISERSARELAEVRPALVGIDTWNVDDTTTHARPVHTALLGAGVLIVEHLTGLAALPQTGALFSVVPLAVEGAVSLPVRAWAQLPAEP